MKLKCNNNYIRRVELERIKGTELLTVKTYNDDIAKCLYVIIDCLLDTIDNQKAVSAYSIVRAGSSLFFTGRITATISILNKEEYLPTDIAKRLLTHFNLNHILNRSQSRYRQHSFFIQKPSRLKLNSMAPDNNDCYDAYQLNQ